MREQKGRRIEIQDEMTRDILEEREGEHERDQ